MPWKKCTSWIATSIFCALLCACGSEPPSELEVLEKRAQPILVPTFQQQAYVKASNTEAYDMFAYRYDGMAVSADGNTLAVGSWLEAGGATGINGPDNNLQPASGAVYVYTRTSAGWAQQAYVKSSNNGSHDLFGSAVALSSDGNTLAVGAPGEASSATGVGGSQSNDSADHSGAVYVFTRSSAGVWTQQAYVKATNSEAYDEFGGSVSLSGNGNLLAVGATFESSSAIGVGGSQTNNTAVGSGAVYTYARSGTTWSAQSYLKASNTESSDSFGSVVRLSSDGGTLVVAAASEDSAATGVNGVQSDNGAPDSGAVYVFTRPSTQWVQQAYLKATNTQSSDFFGATLSVSGDGNTLVIGAFQEDSAATGVNGSQTNDDATDSGAAYVYTRSSGTWSISAYLKASNTAPSDGFGAVAISSDGSMIAVGAGGEGSNAAGLNGNQNDDSLSGSGAVYVFVRSGGSWVQRDYVKASNPDAGDAFARPVLSADGSVLIVAATGERSSAVGVNGNQGDNSSPIAGAVYAFAAVSVPTFAHEAYVKASNTSGGDYFARRVALSADGTTLAVAADQEDSNATGVGGDGANDLAPNSGAVYVYVRSGTTWSFQAYIKPLDTHADDHFGCSLSIASNGSTIAVGACGEDSSVAGIGGNASNDLAPDSGAVYVFVRSSSTWSQQAYIKASNTGAGDAFGASIGLAANGNTLAVGASHEASNQTGVGTNGTNDLATDAGAAYVFVRSGSTWSQQAYIKASNTGAGDQAYVVGLSPDGNTLALGAPGEDSSATLIGGSQSNDGATDSGAVYVYKRSSSTWSFQAYVKASNTEASDAFGKQLSLSSNGNLLAVGTDLEDSNARGINGSPVDNSSSGSGAVYLFARTGSTWTHQLYIKSSNSESGDAFGSSVALSADGTTLAVGARNEDSNATNVNGNQFNNSTFLSGAVYVFSLSASSSAQSGYVKASNTGLYDMFGYSVSLSSDGSRLAVGASFEGSHATLVGGNQSNNSATAAGAAYVLLR
jgi:hypothetical protein